MVTDIVREGSEISPWARRGSPSARFGVDRSRRARRGCRACCRARSRSRRRSSRPRAGEATTRLRSPRCSLPRVSSGSGSLPRTSPTRRRCSAFDLVVTGAIQSLRSPFMTSVMTAVTVLGGIVAVTAVTVALAVVLGARRRGADAVFIACAVGGGALLSTLAKGHFGRGRPPASNALIVAPESFSFPSGHAMASLCLGVALGYLALHSQMRSTATYAALAGCILYAGAVGMSRVYLGVHWPSDVVASWLLGGAWLAIVVGLAERLRRSETR